MLRLSLVLSLLSSMSCLLSAQTRELTQSNLLDHASSSAVVSYEGLPLFFEANRGQTADAVKFLARASSATVFLTGNEAVLALTNEGVDPAEG